jgi:putative SOS response-associated peptidase YedK
MCGRYTRDYTWEQIYRMYLLIQQTPSRTCRQTSMSPTQIVDVILASARGRSLAQMRWAHSISRNYAVGDGAEMRACFLG